MPFFKERYAIGVRCSDALLRRFETELARLLCPIAVLASYGLSADMSPWWPPRLHAAALHNIPCTDVALQSFSNRHIAKLLIGAANFEFVFGHVLAGARPQRIACLLLLPSAADQVRLICYLFFPCTCLLTLASNLYMYDEVSCFPLSRFAACHHAKDCGRAFFD